MIKLFSELFEPVSDKSTLICFISLESDID